MGFETRVVLNEREQTHGDFSVTAKIAQQLKSTLRLNTVEWHKLQPEMRESLEMIELKIARILSGDATEEDHWRDIIGYSQLVLDKLEKDKQ